MTWDELLNATVLGKEIKVILIKPVRNGEYFTEGRMCGYKSGIVGGGWNSNKTRYETSKLRYIKKPKVCVVYNIFEMHKKPYMDWVDVDNCTFEIIEVPHGNL